MTGRTKSLILMALAAVLLTLSVVLIFVGDGFTAVVVSIAAFVGFLLAVGGAIYIDEAERRAGR